MGLIAAFAGCQSLDVTPCCSGPAPMIIEAQFGLLTVGITPRACSVYAPSFIIRARFGDLRLPHAVGAEAVDPDDHDVLDPLDLPERPRGHQERGQQ